MTLTPLELPVSLAAPDGESPYSCKTAKEQIGRLCRKADPRTAHRYDGSRHILDRSPTYLLAAASTTEVSC